jgi:hypothetical protein
MIASTLMLRRVGKGACEEIGATHGLARAIAREDGRKRPNGPRGPVLDTPTAWAKLVPDADRGSLCHVVSFGRLIPGDFAHPTAEAFLP